MWPLTVPALLELSTICRAAAHGSYALLEWWACLLAVRRSPLRIAWGVLPASLWLLRSRHTTATGPCEFFGALYRHPGLCCSSFVAPPRRGRCHCSASRCGTRVACSQRTRNSSRATTTGGGAVADLSADHVRHPAIILSVTTSAAISANTASSTRDCDGGRGGGRCRIRGTRGAVSFADTASTGCNFRRPHGLFL